MSRHSAREIAFKLIYERAVVGEANSLTYNVLISEEDDAQKDYLQTIYNGVLEKYDFLKSVISSYSKDFNVERIFKVDLSIILLSIYEILFMEDIPDNVSINEALELSKIYSTDKSTKFINGILAPVIKNKEALILKSKDKKSKDKKIEDDLIVNEIILNENCSDKTDLTTDNNIVDEISKEN